MDITYQSRAGGEEGEDMNRPDDRHVSRKHICVGAPPCRANVAMGRRVTPLMMRI